MSAPVTTIVPFNALPSCATNCGPLYDANGACVPPAAPQGDENSYRSCFCSYSKLQPFKTTTAGVCDANCDAAGLNGVQQWFTGFCNGKDAANPATTSGSSKSGSSGSTQGVGGDWLSTHWQWVIFIVVVVVGIAAIWTGACIWRRKYLRKKDRMYELGKGLPSSVAVNAQGDLVGPGARNQPGVFMPGAAGAGLTEKPKKERKKWNVTERT